MKMREVVRRLRLYTNPISISNKDLETKSHQEPVVEAMEAAAPVGSAAPAASIGGPEVVSASEVEYTQL